MIEFKLSLVFSLEESAGEKGKEHYLLTSPYVFYAAFRPPCWEITDTPILRQYTVQMTFRMLLTHGTIPISEKCWTHLFLSSLSIYWFVFLTNHLEYWTLTCDYGAGKLYMNCPFWDQSESKTSRITSRGVKATKSFSLNLHMCTILTHFRLKPECKLIFRLINGS